MSVMTNEDHCENPGRWQYVYAGFDGRNYLPRYIYCDDHIDEVQPPESTHVLPVDGNWQCDFNHDDLAEADEQLFQIAPPRLRVVTDDDNS